MTTKVEYVAVRLRSKYKIYHHDDGKIPDGVVAFTGEYDALKFVVNDNPRYVILPASSNPTYRWMERLREAVQHHQRLR